MGEITLRKALVDYKTIYMPYRNFAERTREEYTNDLEDFVRFSESWGIGKVGEMGLPIVHRYVAHLEEKGYSSLTRKRKVVAIRSFLLFLYQDEYIQANLSTKIVVPFAGSVTPHVLTQSECERLRKACTNNARDSAIVELLLQTGMRLSEITRLTLDDIDWVERKETPEALGGYVRIMGGRARKERIMPLDFAACVKLRKYLSVRDNAKTPVLFLNRFGNPLGERGVQKTLRKYIKKAEIGTASIHTLRHTFGTGLTRQGQNKEMVKELMGDKDSRSVAVYFALSSSVVDDLPT